MKKQRICSRCREKDTQSPYSCYCLECSIIKVRLRESIQNKTCNEIKKMHYRKYKDDPFRAIKKRLIERECQRKKYKHDKRHRIGVRLRNCLNNAMKSYTINGKVMSSKKYGIDYNAIIEHLKPFPEDMNKYHIDHIKPLSLFNLEDAEEVKAAFMPENHQWLLAEDNIKKSNKYHTS